jgi:hypothetical protein
MDVFFIKGLLCMIDILDKTVSKSNKTVTGQPTVVINAAAETERLDNFA